MQNPETGSPILSIHLSRTADGFRAELSNVHTTVEAPTVRQLFERLESEIAGLVLENNLAAPTPDEEEAQALDKIATDFPDKESFDRLTARYAHVSRADEPPWIDE